jgi:broad specificity phosphatase PhoE
MHLYLIRHGESGGNTGADPSDDPALTDRGLRQSQLVADAIAQVSIAVLYSSPLVRALQTAWVMSARLGLPINAWPDLAEFWGERRDVMTRSEIARRWPAVVLPPDMAERWAPAKVPEDEAAAYARAARVEAAIRERYESSDTAVAAISHGTFGAILLSKLIGAPPCGYTRFSQHNCCISRVELLPGRAKIVYHNRTSHLPPDLIT